jgi:hypothetical protein
MNLGHQRRRTWARDRRENAVRSGPSIFTGTTGTRRQAAGAALYGVMSDLIFRTAPIDRTVFDAVVEAAEREGPAPSR